jgi:hypothetical protein
VVDVASGGVVTHGQSVGNKRIDFLMAPAAAAGACEFPTDLGTTCMNVSNHYRIIACIIVFVEMLKILDSP